MRLTASWVHQIVPPDRPFDVDLDHPVDGRRIGLGQPAKLPGEAGIVDQAGKPTVALVDSLEKRRYLLSAGNVAALSEGLAAGVDDDCWQN
jgi:hypothetical protein